MVVLFIMNFEYMSIHTNMVFYPSYSCTECIYRYIGCPQKTGSVSKVSCGASSVIFNYYE